MTATDHGIPESLEIRAPAQFDTGTDPAGSGDEELGVSAPSSGSGESENERFLQ